MAELVNLRNARKQAKRRQSEQPAGANRLAHGLSKNSRKLEEARKVKAVHDLERHRIETGGRR